MRMKREVGDGDGKEEEEEEVKDSGASFEN